MFRASSRLLDCRITLFTRANCSLCDTAKAVVENVKVKRPFAYHEVNVMEPGQEKWKEVYEFDTPVVCEPELTGCIAQLTRQIHVDKGDAPATTTSALKLMHRFKEDQVLQKMDEAEQS
jgi:hypothetical protein